MTTATKAGKQADGQRDAPADQGAGQQVAAGIVGAEAGNSAAGSSALMTSVCVRRGLLVDLGSRRRGRSGRDSGDCAVVDLGRAEVNGGENPLAFRSATRSTAARMRLTTSSAAASIMSRPSDRRRGSAACARSPGRWCTDAARTTARRCRRADHERKDRRLTRRRAVGLEPRPGIGHRSERPADRVAEDQPRCSVIAHPRVDDGVEDVDDQVEDDGEDGDHHDRAHHQRVVAVERGIDEIAADARG